MLIKDLQVGPIETNCYIVTDENTLDCVVIDPGDESNLILDYLEEHRLKCRYIFLTHGHFDHTLASEIVADETGASIYINSIDLGEGSPPQFCLEPTENVKSYSEGDVFSVGSLSFEIIETPGHTPGGVCIVCQDVLFTGDTLFRSTIGRTDLPGGNIDDLFVSLKRLYELPGDYEVYPGHDLTSTLERERRFNEFMRIAADM